MNARLNKVRAVENIINEEVQVLEASMKRLDAEPFVKDVFKNIDELRETGAGKSAADAQRARPQKDPYHRRSYKSNCREHSLNPDEQCTAGIRTWQI